MVEKAYKSMRNVGAASIAVGIVVLTVGIVAGVLSIVGGARLLKNKQELTF